MSDREAVSELKARAERAAASIVAEYDVHLPNVTYELVVSLIAVGWIEGRQAGGEEARQLVRDEMARLVGSGLHAVKVTVPPSCGNPSCMERGVDRHVHSHRA